MGAGDEIFIQVWGSVDANLRLLVDREGRLTIPKVGAVNVGVKVAVSMGQMRGIRVYVTGFA